MQSKKLWSPWRMDYIKNPDKGKNIFKNQSRIK